MKILEIKQILPATGHYALYYGDDEKAIDPSFSLPVVLWANCICKDGDYIYPAILGYVFDEIGLEPAEDCINFAVYSTDPNNSAFLTKQEEMTQIKEGNDG